MLVWCTGDLRPGGIDRDRLKRNLIHYLDSDKKIKQFCFPVKAFPENPQVSILERRLVLECIETRYTLTSVKRTTRIIMDEGIFCEVQYTPSSREFWQPMCVLERWKGSEYGSLAFLRFKDSLSVSHGSRALGVASTPAFPLTDEGHETKIVVSITGHFLPLWV